MQGNRSLASLPSSSLYAVVEIAHFVTLDADDAVLAGLKSDHIAADINDLSDHAADRRDLSPTERLLRISSPFSFSVFRTDHEDK
jgi:hypothetical protein